MTGPLAARYENRPRPPLMSGRHQGPRRRGGGAPPSQGGAADQFEISVRICNNRWLDRLPAVAWCPPMPSWRSARASAVGWTAHDAVALLLLPVNCHPMVARSYLGEDGERRQPGRDACAVAVLPTWRSTARPGASVMPFLHVLRGRPSCSAARIQRHGGDLDPIHLARPAIGAGRLRQLSLMHDVGDPARDLRSPAGKRS